MENRYTTAYFEKYALYSLARYDPVFSGILYAQIKDESPDFQIASLNLGIEVTRAITTEQGNKHLIITDCDRHGLSARSITIAAQAGFPKIKGKIISRGKKAVYRGPPADTSAFCGQIEHSILSKTKKLNGNYEVFDQNWLYIFSPFPCLQQDDIKKIAADLSAPLDVYPIQFDKVFINCISTIFVLTNHSSISTLHVGRKALQSLDQDALR